MALDIELLKNNPASFMTLYKNRLLAENTDEFTIEDPTNPWIMQFEGSITLANAVLNEQMLLMRRNYPNLARVYSDLLPHITDEERVNIFAEPGSAIIRFAVNLLDLKQKGYTPDEGDSWIILIPPMTKIITPSAQFTTMNGVRLKYYTNSKKVNVEQLVGTSDISYTNLGVLESQITTDTTGNTYIIFETYVKQLSYVTSEESIVTSRDYKKKIALDGQYHYAEAFIKNTSTGNTWSEIGIIMDDLNFNADVLSLKAEITDTDVTFSIPDVFIINDSFKGNIKIIVYTTKGGVTLNVENYAYEDNSITFGPEPTGSSTEDKYAIAAIKNVYIRAKAMSALSGGRHAKTFTELKESIINNTIGFKRFPTTERDIDELLYRYGYSIHKVIDTATERLFKCHKELPFSSSSGLFTRLDVFNITTTVIGSENVSSDIIVNDSQGTVIIKANTIFKDDNGVVSAISDAEKTTLLLSNNNQTTSDIVNNGKYYITPYHYVSEINETNIRTDAYDLTSPTISNHIIDSKYIGDVTANIAKYDIATTETGFVLAFTIIGNDTFNNDYLSSAKIQVSIPLFNGTENVYYTAVNNGNGYFIVNIETDFFISKTDQINITNGTSSLAKKACELTAKMKLIIYVPVELPIANQLTITDPIISGDEHVTYISREYVTVTFGTNMEHLWKHSYIDYTERKYKKYLVDEQYYYETDVYDEDPTTGSFFTITDENSDGTFETIGYNILHNAGDPVLVDGEPIYKHRANETMIDEVTGLPIVDMYSGVATTIDLTAYELEYYFAKEATHAQYLVDTLSVLRTFMVKDLVTFNDSALERTFIKFSGTRKNTNIKIKSGSSTYTVPSVIVPDIMIYVGKTTDTASMSTSDIIRVIGTILHKELDKDAVNFKTVKDEVIDAFNGDVFSIAISGINDFTIEYFTYQREDEKMTIDKKTTVDVNNDINVEYNINLTVNKI